MNEYYLEEARKMVEFARRFPGRIDYASVTAWAEYDPSDESWSVHSAGWYNYCRTHYDPESAAADLGERWLEEWREAA